MGYGMKVISNLQLLCVGAESTCTYMYTRVYAWLLIFFVDEGPHLARVTGLLFPLETH